MLVIKVAVWAILSSDKKENMVQSDYLHSFWIWMKLREVEFGILKGTVGYYYEDRQKGKYGAKQVLVVIPGTRYLMVIMRVKGGSRELTWGETDE